MQENQTEKIISEERALAAEEKILAEKEAALEKTEKKLEKEIASEKQSLRKLNQRVMILSALIVLVLGGGIASLAYFGVSSSRVYIEKSQISAPITDLASKSSGILQELDVAPGDVLSPNQVVGRVGNELIKSFAGGEVISVNNNVGKLFNPGQAVASVIDPSELRVIGRLEEDKGLSSVRVGQRAIFTVDAFGGKKFEGVVDEISPTARSSDVVFNISDKREQQEFEVKVRFDISAYPELKNGMSAKIWVYKN